MPEGMITVESPDLEALAKKYGERGRPYILGTINKILRGMGKTLVPAVKSETPKGASNKLRNTTVFEVLGKSEDQRMEIRQSAFSPNGFPYGVAVRMGTRPHFPPYEALIPWVQRKLSVENPRNVAFLIARKISQKGTKENPYHQRAFDKKRGELDTIVKNEMTALEKTLGSLK